MDKHGQLAAYIKNHPDAVGPVVDFDPATDRLYQFDFTSTHTGLTPEDIADTSTFSSWVDQKLVGSACRYGIGGYMEHRTLYARSELFNNGEEPRRLHLGVDIWSAAGTSVYLPIVGKIHSFRDNNHFGDYGPTIIVEHQLDELTLYSLYGHLSRASLDGLKAGQQLEKGEKIAALGDMEENGHWPPHLHFQLMFDMDGLAGDYPGVCAYSEKAKYQANIPDPELILQFGRATIMQGLPL